MAVLSFVFNLKRQNPQRVRPFTLANISGLSSGWAQNASFVLGCPGTDSSRTRFGFVVGFGAARFPLYVICRLEHKAVVWEYDRLLTRFER